MRIQGFAGHSKHLYAEASHKGAQILQIVSYK